MFLGNSVEERTLGKQLSSGFLRLRGFSSKEVLIMDLSWSTVLHDLASFAAISCHLDEGSLAYLWVGEKAVILDSRSSKDHFSFIK